MVGTPQRLLQRALRYIPAPASSNQNNSIYLALSGGVDSSVAGFLLKEKGWKVKPILMRCWDDDTAENDSVPCYEAELKAASLAAKSLGVQSELQVFDFVQEYWTDVFDGVFLSGLRAGSTPNPDLACNKSIKFGALPSRLKQVTGSTTVPVFATGHYARLRCDETKKTATLLYAADQKKDQTYFLSSVRGSALASAVFPVGDLLKSEVREIAAFAELPAAKAKSSRGICFVGKRRMAPFLERYIPEHLSGNFIDIDTGNIVDKLPFGQFAYTVGQRARIGGLQSDPMYVVGRSGRDVLVATGHSNPHLYVHSVKCPRVDWVAGFPPQELEDNCEMELEFKANSASDRKGCRVRKARNGVYITFDDRQRIIADGQAVVLYSGDICLGAAWPCHLDSEGE